MALPPLSLVLTDWYPSWQKHCSTRAAPGSEVLFMGQAFCTPVQHQKPGSHGLHAAFWVPLKPAAQ
jgi:hypothetical protein